MSRAVCAFLVRWISIHVLRLLKSSCVWVCLHGMKGKGEIEYGETGSTVLVINRSALSVRTLPIDEQNSVGTHFPCNVG